VDEYGTKTAFDINAALEFTRNRERYMLSGGRRPRSRISARFRRYRIVHQVTSSTCERSLRAQNADGSWTAYRIRWWGPLPYHL